MQIVSWNIQAAKGVDDRVSVERIAGTVQSFGDTDVICFQEVLCDDGATVLGNRDQVGALSACFPDHLAFFGSAIDRLSEHGRLRFGNLALCRLPVLQCVMHKLPQPVDATARYMPRQAVELLIDDGFGPLRIVSTHLEYFSAWQRRAQVAYLARLHRDSEARAFEPPTGGGEGQFASLPETARSLYCGDFNLTPHSDDYRALVDADAGAGLVDCWARLHPDVPHASTCGMFDHVQWPEGAHCRDYFFASKALAPQVSGMRVDTETTASDHQPIALTLSGSPPA